MNVGASWPSAGQVEERVLGIQRKLHKWARDDQTRRFDDLHNLVCEPATLRLAWQRVRGNRGSRSAGVDGQTAYILVCGERRHATQLVADTQAAIAPLGLALSAEKTRVVLIDEGFEFLGFAIKRCRGRHGRRHVYTYPSRSSLAAVMRKLRRQTRIGHDQTLDQLLHRLNPVLRGWCAYFRHGVSKRTFNYLRAYTWRRVIAWLRRKHPKANWRWMRATYLPGWWPTYNGVELYNPGGVAVTRYSYRGAKIPTPWQDGRLRTRDPAVVLERLTNLITA